jgi:hypothetical protein
MKASVFKKAVKALKTLTEPFNLPEDLAALDGIGAGLVKRIHTALVEGAAGSSAPGPAIVEEAKQHMQAAGKDVADEWIEGSDRDVIIDLLKSKSLTLKQVLVWRSDISAADFN